VLEEEGGIGLNGVAYAYQKNEVGLGFRLLHDMSMALFCKLWWNFRTKTSLWNEYMKNKYCKNMTANQTMWRTGCRGSQVWKRMIQARDLIEHQILWQARKGSSLVWHDNWTGLGDLYTITGDNFNGTAIMRELLN